VGESKREKREREREREYGIEIENEVSVWLSENLGESKRERVFVCELVVWKKVKEREGERVCV